jgi:hypothetical protein
MSALEVLFWLCLALGAFYAGVCIACIVASIRAERAEDEWWDR